MYDAMMIRFPVWALRGPLFYRRFAFMASKGSSIAESQNSYCE